MEVPIPDQLEIDADALDTHPAVMVMRELLQATKDASHADLGTDLSESGTYTGRTFNWTFADSLDAGFQHHSLDAYGGRRRQLHVLWLHL